jgi:tRNA (guanine37-N1)-methyltransferase
MQIDVFTLFPEMFPGPLGVSVSGRALERGIVSVAVHNLRDSCTDRHRVTDDVPFGGGGGMVMKPEPIFAAVESAMGAGPDRAPVALLSPQGRVFDHSVALEYAARERFGLVCGHYEGVDERVREHLVSDEISLGDCVLTGGELAAMVIIDAVCRLQPGALGDPGAAADDSFAHGLLECPQYTRPRSFRAHEVPEVLLSGNHAEIARWRRKECLRRTLSRRPELLDAAPLTAQDRRVLKELSDEELARRGHA